MADYTTIDDPSKYFQVTTYTGDGGTQDITHSGNSNLQADLIWIKNRDAESNHILQDTSRGITKQFFVDNNAIEYDSGNWGHVNSVSSNGFQVDEGNSGEANANKNTQKYVSWNWKVNGGTTSANTTGGMNSTVQVNTTAGISIFTFTADGTTNSVGHGLGVKPDVVMIRRRSASGPGMILLTDLINGSQDYGYMHIADNFDDIGYGVHTSSLVEYNDTNTTTQVGYAFTQIQGFSKFGQYTGNGISEGPFVYCGFKPAWVMIKNTDTDARNWYMYDNARRTFNPNGLKIYADTADQEATDQSIDLYSTGFKVKPGDLGSYGTSSTNHSGQQMFYMAFAESPFVSSEGVPTTAY